MKENILCIAVDSLVFYSLVPGAIFKTVYVIRLLNNLDVHLTLLGQIMLRTQRVV